ncbi:MAG: hypothetical protein WDM80_17565 [Limisphaerales bacterium]
MRIIQFIFCFLLAMLLCGFGCSSSKPTPDPLASWQPDFKEQPNQVIVNDYQNYIQQLPPEERKLATVDDWREDGTGQHAIKITVGLDGTNWRHVLIYDKENKRIKTVKYASGDSHS